MLGHFDNNNSTESDNAESVLVVMFYYLLIFHSMLKTWPTSLCRYREASACIRNVEAIFHINSNHANSSDDSSALLDFKVESSLRVKASCRATTDNLENFPSISMKNLVSKNENSEDVDSFELRCEQLKLTKGKKYFLMGSSEVERRQFIQVLLGERQIDSGEVEIVGRRSFASRNPCIIKGSIQQNVLMTEVYDEDKYKSIIEMCDLTRDEEALNGCEIDEISTFNECCVTLTSRINLARWLYADAEIYIVEMPFYDDDNEIGNIIISKAMKRLAKVGNAIAWRIIFKSQMSCVLQLLSGSARYSKFSNSSLLPLPPFH